MGCVVVSDIRTVCIPYRATPDREPIFEYVSDWWIRHGFTVVVGDSDHEVFNRAGARNNAVSQVNGRIVVADADTIPDITVVERALLMNGVVHPFDEYRLIEFSDSYENPPVLEYMRNSPGGIWVLDTEDWWGVGGQDELFTGWGFEDEAFLHAVRTLGKYSRLKGLITAFNHKGVRDMSVRNPNASRIELYRFANGRPNVMRELCRR